MRNASHFRWLKSALRIGAEVWPIIISASLWRATLQGDVWYLQVWEDVEHVFRYCIVV